MTCHRRENYGQPMTNIMRALRRMAEDFPQVELVYPVHLSPVVQEVARAHLAGHRQNPFDRTPYARMKCTISWPGAAFVMTDSGGTAGGGPRLGQAGAGAAPGDRAALRPWRRARCCWRGRRKTRFTAMAARLLTDPAAYRAMAQAVNPYGDGQACRRIADAILWKWGLRDQPPEEFSAG